MKETMAERNLYLREDLNLIQRNNVHVKNPHYAAKMDILGNVGTFQHYHDAPDKYKQRPMRVLPDFKNRYNVRQEQPETYQCILSVKFENIDVIPDMKMARIKLAFKSNCQVGLEYKYLTAKTSQNEEVPYELNLLIFGKEFRFEFDKKT